MERKKAGLKKVSFSKGFLVGDVHIWKGYKFEALLARLLIKVRNMLPFKETWNHVSIAVDAFTDVSAETKRGVQTIDLNSPDLVRNAELRTYRFRRLTRIQRARILKEYPYHLGRRYAFTFWVLNGLTVLLFYMFLLNILPVVLFTAVALIFRLAPLAVWVSLGLLGLFLVFWLVVRLAVLILRRLDHQYEHCSENFAAIFQTIGLWSPLAGNPNLEFPNGILQVLENLRLQGVVDLVHVKPRGRVYPCASSPIPPVMTAASDWRRFHR